ncbi:hypothetical protein [Coprococcus sp. AF21-14LB]|uniref:hypothetical protein n=1 Tax=Coprococcus sp. AF21-14LB TaxID=2292231 RepID=UPI00131445B7|nr:hypothetical protein [Coprococcus sp. AF21-14LB]
MEISKKSAAVFAFMRGRICRTLLKLFSECGKVIGRLLEKYGNTGESDDREGVP